MAQFGAVIFIVAGFACDRASAQSAPHFVGLGDLAGGDAASSALNISADGKTVVGMSKSNNGNEGYRWKDGLMTALKGFGVPPYFTVANAVSADGSIVVGSASTSKGTQAVMWSGDAGVVLSGLPEDATYSAAWGVSDDGKTVVGHMRTGMKEAAFLWRDGVLQELPAAPSGVLARSAQAVSADGSVIVGILERAGGTEAFSFNSGVVMGLGDLPGASNLSSARGVSSNGQVVVGSSESTWGHEATIWKSGHMIALGGISEHHEFFGFARDASADGSVVVGTTENDSGATEAFIWTASTGLRSVRDVLAALPGVDLAGWSLMEATGISDDGLSIVGYGKNPKGMVEAWLARLPEPALRGPRFPDDRPAVFGSFHKMIDGLSEPAGVAISNDGSTYIADSGNNCIRVFDRDGIVTGTFNQSTDANSPLRSPHGVAIAPNGMVFVADTENDRVVAYDKSGGPVRNWGTFGAQPSQFNRPCGIAADDQKVFISDTGNNRIQVFDHQGKLLSIWGGFGDQPGQFRTPIGMAIHSSGGVLVADSGNHRIQHIGSDGRCMNQWGQRGRVAGFFMNPSGVVCTQDRVYVADTGNHRIQVFDATGKFRYACGARVMRPHEGDGKLHFPDALAIAPNGLFAVVCESREDRCQIFEQWREDHSGDEMLRVPLAVSAPDSAYFGPSFDIAGSLVAVVQPDQDSIEVLDISLTEGRVVARVGETGSRFGQLNNPVAVKIDAPRSRMFVSDAGNRRLQVYEFNPDWIRNQGMIPAAAKFSRSIDCQALRNAAVSLNGRSLADVVPGDIEIDGDGNVYFLDTSNRIVFVLNSDLTLRSAIGQQANGSSQFRKPTDMSLIVVDGRATALYVVDEGESTVSSLDTNGVLLTKWGKPGMGAGEFNHPYGITVGKDGSVLVTDEHRVQKFDQDGKFIAQWGSRGIKARQLFKPRGIAYDDKGRVVVLDWGNHRLKLFTPDGGYAGVYGALMYIRPPKFDQD